MAESPGPAGEGPLFCDGLAVEKDDGMQVASLRYFPGRAPFAQAVREVLGVGLPAALQALALPSISEASAAVGAQSPPAQLLLAWRSPTETLCLAGNASIFAPVRALVARRADGCLVDLTSGLQVLRLSGERIAELLSRLGGYGSVPQPGETRRSRLADVPVFALSVQPAETWLLVDRAYLPHLLDWIRETVRDLPGCAPEPRASRR